ncbi:glutathione peroxidase [Malaciobacter halophilus]|nr:glutathione peroxidase [Malaciobacter halophilus]AXH10020.1 glutathione peroxidase [Malaciobacter halophilus]
MRILILTILFISSLIGANMKSIYDFEVETIDGKKVSLSDYKNKVLLIVNVASKCGFTSQYEGLEKLYDKYKTKDFVVLGFPCNQFMNQEPGTNEEIKEFCSLTYNVSFPMFSKIDVNGDEAHPLYKYLKNEASGLLGTEAIKWNFTKFLVDKNGKVIDRFSPSTTPENIEDDIKKLL